MQIKTIAIDDEPLALRLLKEYTSRIPYLRLSHTFTDALAAQEFLKAHEVDLIFVDINMPDITGLELVRKLQPAPVVIFVTAYKQYAHEGFELDAADYLLKPVSFERFERAVNKARDLLQLRQHGPAADDGYLMVRAEYQLIRIPFSDIEYIESLQDYIRIHRLSGKPVMTLMTMKNLLTKLPQDRFRRIHRSYLVALDKVRSVASRKVRLSHAELPVSTSYLDFLNQWRP